MDTTQKTSASPLTKSQALLGKFIQPKLRVTLMGDAQFEELIGAWLPKLAIGYAKVLRLGGPGDLGRDICGLCDASGFRGVWDNYQCKRYKDRLAPGDVRPEIGKILWHVWNDEYSCPRVVRFCGSSGIGTKLTHLLNDAKKLKEDIISNWAKAIQNRVTETGPVMLEGEFLNFVQGFDFRIFQGLEVDEVLDALKGTAYYVQEFGGGLPSRPSLSATPAEIAEFEQKYVEKLFAVYAERTGKHVAAGSDLDGFVGLRKHFDRQRTSFYAAESLREFARDYTPHQTFELFQDDIFTSIIEIRDSDHPNSYARLQAVLKQAANVPPSTNALYEVADARDKQGVCHQLANIDRLNWTSS